MASYKAIGLMSGTSLDGIDLAYVQFTKEDDKWTYQILQTAYVPYPNKWKLRLGKLVLQNAITYLKTHTFYGHYLGEVLNDFIETYQIREEVDFIASHGQTIFHQPEHFLTSQIGDGAAIAAKTKLPVVCNFRTVDVALQGQGAPIVPIGDKHLFNEYKFCLNLGGIANISTELNSGEMLGYDICACNLVLNKLANQLGFNYDNSGQIAESGKVNQDLLKELAASWYYDKAYPKTLGGGWVNKVFTPIFKNFHISIEDKLRTAVEHIAIQITRDINLIYAQERLLQTSTDSLLVTGGGAYNAFLINRLKEMAPVNIVVPDAATIDYKEALLMAFIGVLRVRGEVNCLSSVTGADMDNVGGAIYYGGGKLI